MAKESHPHREERRRDSAQEANERPAGLTTSLTMVSQRLARVEASLGALHALVSAAQAEQNWFSTNEVSLLLHKSRYTVRQWCIGRRLRATKTTNGRQWRIHRDELARYRREGLLPL